MAKYKSYICFVISVLIISGTDSFLVDEGVSEQQTCACGPRSCEDVSDSNPRPVVTLANGMEVVCDTTTDEGGWVVFQRRASSAVDFYQNWDEYKYGFGDVHGNFWLGLEKIHQLTYKRRYELRVDIVHNGTDYYAHYDSFMLYGEPENYKLRVSGYSGTAGDSLLTHSGHPFTTKDKDNDANSYNCAVHYHGAWWYTACHSSNLNGNWGDKHYGQGLDWHSTTGYYSTVELVEMKMRAMH